MYNDEEWYFVLLIFLWLFGSEVVGAFSEKGHLVSFGAIPKSLFVPKEAIWVKILATYELMKMDGLLLTGVVFINRMRNWLTISSCSVD